MGLGAAFLALLSCASSDERRNERFMAEQERLFAGVLQPRSDASLQVWAYRSPEGLQWRREKDPVAHSFSSLGLSVHGAALRLSGQHRLRLPTEEEEEMGLLWTQSLFFDGETWLSSLEAFQDPVISAHSDHQWLGDELWYFASKEKHKAFGDQDGQDPSNLPASRDPLRLPGMHLLRSSPPGRTRIKGAGLGDPAPIIYRDELHVFASRYRGNRVDVVHFHGQDLRREKNFPGVSVPFAAAVGEELWLIAQQSLGGRRQPVLARSTDGNTWTPWQAMVDLGPLANCTSPVMGRLKEEMWLFCVEELRVPG